MRPSMTSLGMPAVALAALLMPASHGSAQEVAESLFVELEPVSQPRVAREPYVVRERRVGVNFDVLAGPGRDTTARRDPRPGATIRLDLFPDASLVVILSRFERYASGRYVWVGYVADRPYQEAIFVVHQGVLTAEISDAPRTFSIRPGRAGQHRVLEVDPTLLPPEHLPVPPSGTANSETKRSSPTTEDSADDIRILVLYTPNARRLAGGTTAIENLAYLGVAQTNSAFLVSGQAARLTMANTQEIDYSESSSTGRDLQWLTESGSIDGVRDQYAADLVAMLTYSISFCGSAWLYGFATPSLAYWGTSVISFDCLSNLSFVHEIGHNLGAGHDPYGGGGAYLEDSRGHVHIGPSAAKSWRTVMSYWNLCVDTFAAVCERLNVFSNPNVSYTGSEAGPTGIEGVSNNARVIGETAGTVANFRSGNGSGGGGGEDSVPGAPSNLTASADGSTVTISWNPPASGDTPTAYILEVGSFSGGTDILVSNVGLGNPLIAENVQPLTAYLAMRATSSAGTGGRSNEVLLVVGGGPGPCTGPPGAVTGLSFTVSGSTVTLTWNNPGGGNAPTTYFLRAGSGPGLSNLVPNLDLGRTNTTLVANSVGSGIYHVRIYPGNNCGVQVVPSNEAIVIVP